MTILDRIGNVPEGLAYKAPCLVATTANIVLSGLQTIDGVSVPANARVLVKDQNDTTQNGIWQASTGNWTRPTDAGSNESWIYGTQVFIHSGTVNGTKVFYCSNTDDPIVIGTSHLSFAQLTVSGVPSTRTISTTAPLTGGGDLSANRTIALTLAAALTVTGAALDLATNGIAYGKIQQVTAQRLLGNPTGSTANVSEIALGATLAFSGTALQTGAATGDVTWSANAFSTTIAANAVTAAKFRQSAGLSVVGNSGTVTANVGDITGIANQVLRVNSAGTALGFGQLNLAASAAITGTLPVANGGTGLTSGTSGGLLYFSAAGTIASSGALTQNALLLGAGAGAAPIAAMALGTDGQLVVGQTSAAPLWKTLSGDATLSAAGAVTIANNAVTYAKFQQVAASSLVGNPTGSLANAQGITLASTLTFSGTTLDLAAAGVTNAKLATMANNTVKGNNSGGSATPSDLSASNVLDMVGSTRGMVLTRGASNWSALGVGTAGQVFSSNGTDPVWTTLAGTGTVTSVATDGSMYGGTITASGTLGVQVPVNPGGRLTLSSGVPVMVSTVSGATTVYYTPYLHNWVPIYDGTRFVLTNLSGEISQATTDATKSPAAVAASKNYDLFVWSDSGTIRCTRGPTWNSGAVAGSDTARGTGAGSTDLTRINGVLVNANAITNGPAANRGTYVGTVRSNGSSTIDFIYGAVAASGTAAVLNVWNTYNRVNIRTLVGDSTDSWTYNSATVRSANGSTTRRISFVCGSQEDSFFFCTSFYGLGSGTNSPTGGIGVDVTNAFSGIIESGITSATISLGAQSQYVGSFLGSHFIQDCEACSGATTCTFYGDAGAPTVLQTGMIGHLRM
jgi:hypothetical protein